MVHKFASRFVVTIMLAFCAVAFSGAFPAGDAYAAKKPILDNPDGTLSATEYYSMLPFVIPIIENNVHKRQLTLVIAIGMFNDGDRDEIRRVSSRFRDAIYRVLFNLISFRTAKPRIPAKIHLERKLFPVVKKLGGDMVKSIKIHKSILGNKP
jgi:hypothetical protein